MAPRTGTSKYGLENQIQGLRFQYRKASSLISGKQMVYFKSVFLKNIKRKRYTQEKSKLVYL